MLVKNEKNIIINKVFNKDSRNILQILEGKVKVKTTITSPPYFDMKDYGTNNQIGFGQNYTDYLSDLQDVFSGIYKITEDEGSLWIIIDTFKRNNQVIPLPFDLSNKLKEIGWLLQEIIIWKKDKTVPWSTNGFMQRKFEYILFFSKSPKFQYSKDKVRVFDTNQLKKWWVKYPERYNPKGKALDEIWEFPIPIQGSWGSKYIRHFCPLPTEMVATIIDISTNDNDIILDPFSGSGSVLFQSAAMKRRYLGFELNQNYIEMFQTYLKENIEKARDDYNSLSFNKDQNYFKDRILKLRALKYGRLLVNKVNKELNKNLRIFVDILEYIENSKVHISVKYSLFDDKVSDSESLILKIDSLINKPPFSKFGIKPEIDYKEFINLDIDGLFYYTSTNSYSYSRLPYDSPKIKVISPLCVDLDENDYA